MTISARTLVISICLALLGTLAGLIPQAQANASGNPDEVSVSTTVYVPVVTPVVRTRPAEDDLGFNPCTMGVDGRYSEADYRHWTPGPCTMATRLPYGARFTVATAPIGDTADCLTRVAVVDRTGQSIVLGAWWSTRCDAPSDIEPLLRAAAAQL